MDQNYPKKCPCCGEGMVYDVYDICGVCGWEDDVVQNEDPTFPGGANKLCLLDYRAEFLELRKKNKDYRWDDRIKDREVGNAEEIAEEIPEEIAEENPKENPKEKPKENPEENLEENKIEIMMVQLLFRQKPKSPTTTQMREALERYLGDLGEIPYVETSKESTGDMFMFPLLKYKAVLKDRPDGVPVMATFLGSDGESGIEVDDAQRYQFWDVPNGNDLIDECKYTILVNTMLGAALSYRDQAEILLAQVDAAIDCYPECMGIYVHQSGKLITPETFRAQRNASLSERFISMFVNARFFNLSDTEEMLVDTLGFYVFGGADVQVHFKNMDPNHVVNYVYNIASYQFDNDFPIQSGETIDSLGEDGEMQRNPQWGVQYEDAMVSPLRTVLDVNCGKFAGGNRG